MEIHVTTQGPDGNDITCLQTAFIVKLNSLEVLESWPYIAQGIITIKAFNCTLSFPGMLYLKLETQKGLNNM